MDKPKHTIPFYNIGQRLARITVCQQQVLRISSMLVLLGCALMGVIGCSNDELPDTEQPDASPQPITIRLDVAALPSLNAHNSRSWQYATGNVEGENIQSAFTLMFDDKFNIERILVLRTDGEGKDKETVGMVDEKNPAAKDGLFRTTTGEKSFLTFVNIPRKVVEAAYAKKRGITGEFHFAEKQSYADAEARNALSEMSIAVRADDFNKTAPSQKTRGIPMTGWHKAMLTYRTHNLRTFTVYALRMLSKLQFDFTNALGQKVKINSIEVDRLTDDATATNGNVKPFPHPATPLGPTDLTVTVKPSLLATATQSPKKFTVNNIEIESGQKASCSFYVNETDVPNNVFHQFTLKLNLTLADGTTQQVRYALVSNESNEWNYIARNDWRIIPILLQDYKLELVPQDFPPIGVLPAAVKSENDVFTCIFHASGDFHLKPQLVQYSTGKVVQTWKNREPLFETLTPNDALYSEKPEWSALDGCIHGSFASNQTGQSVHTLTLKCKPEGGVERLYVVPVIIDKQK